MADIATGEVKDRGADSGGMLSNGLRRSFFLGFELDLSGHRNLAMAIRSEVTMLERAALALCLTLPATRGSSADPNVVDVSTWRWNVSAILRAQHDDEINSPSKDARLRQGSFGQQYERYLPNGVRDTASKGLGR
jgi:hypothetical protein